MVVDLGYPQDFGTSWCFRFQSLPSFQVRDLMVMVEAKSCRAMGDPLWFASKIEEKLWKNSSNPMVDQHVPQ